VVVAFAAGRDAAAVRALLVVRPPFVVTARGAGRLAFALRDVDVRAGAFTGRVASPPRAGLDLLVLRAALEVDARGACFAAAFGGVGLVDRFAPAPALAGAPLAFDLAGAAVRDAADLTALAALGALTLLEGRAGAAGAAAFGLVTGLTAAFGVAGATFGAGGAAFGA
jgi:hypothetical protein